MLEKIPGLPRFILALLARSCARAVSFAATGALCRSQRFGGRQRVAACAVMFAR